MERKRFLDAFSRTLASYIYAEAVQQTESGSYIVYFEEVNGWVHLKNYDSIEKDKELLNRIVEELKKYEGIAEVTLTEEGFDIILYTDYCGVGLNDDDLKSIIIGEGE